MLPGRQKSVNSGNKNIYLFILIPSQLPTLTLSIHMLYYLGKNQLTSRSCRRLLMGLLLLGRAVWGPWVVAQTLDTQPLSVSSVCPGAQIDVTGFRGAPAESYTVELSSNGTAYAAIPSSFLAASGRYEITYRATIPATTPPGTTYRVRLVSKNPDLNGTPSSTTLTVNARPEPPLVLSNISECARAAASTVSTFIISVTASSPAASTQLYNQDGSVAGYSRPSSDPKSFEMNLGLPGIRKYYVTQQIDGCESDRKEINVTIKPLPPVVVPLNAFTIGDGGVYGKINLCQGDKAVSLKDFGIKPLPDNVVVQYIKESGDLSLTGLPDGNNGEGTTIPPIPATDKPGTATITFRTYLDGCPASRDPASHLVVTVNARPAKPTVTAATISICKAQSASPLSATTTVANASLVWYGADAAGGIGTSAPTQPSTEKVGTFKYYVAQKSGDCESERAEITVNVVESPAAPLVTAAYSYCQKTPAPALTASGTNLKWYDMAGNSSATAPTPSTDNPGTVSYFVTQSADNCESPRAEIKVITKPTPSAPTTAALVVCQNTAAPTLTAVGQNLLWYTAETGGTGAAAPPVVNTSQTGLTTYYVSQRADGCEGPRAALAVSVKAIPAAPGVSPKSVCQFSPPERVTATGDNLTWYNIDGNRFNEAPAISTDNGASYSVLVTQTVNGCESPKATLIITVVATPAPTVSKTTVELCQGGASQPLEASGTGLKWTDPTGVVSTTAPTPLTVNATKNPDGDAFYVTQTVNGCESPRATIRVFVQTLPTLSVLGTTTTNLGKEVPLNLKFTGIGPYRYKLTNGITGTATKDTSILVLPEQTTIYQVTEVANKCGTGLPGNGFSATITVLVPSIQTQPFTSATLCAGTTVSTNFITSGSFTEGSVFKLQLAKVETDSTKIVFVDALNSQAENGQISGTIPGNTAAGTYWVRVLATNPKIPIKGTVSPTLLTVRPLPVATLIGNQTILEGQPASLSVVFSGDGPWAFSYRDSTAAGLGNVQSVTTTANPHSFVVRPVKTTAYVLTAVSNTCGRGTLTARLVVVNVNPLLGIEDQSLADAVAVYPVPATTTLMVRIRGLAATQPALLEITDLAGHTTHQQETRQATSTVSLHQHPPGTYILRIRVGDRTASKRIVKL